MSKCTACVCLESAEIQIRGLCPMWRCILFTQCTHCCCGRSWFGHRTGLLGFGKKNNGFQSKMTKKQAPNSHDKSKWVLEFLSVVVKLRQVCRPYAEASSSLLRKSGSFLISDLCQGANGTTNSDGGGVATWMKLASRCKRCHKFEQFWVLTSFRRRGSTVVHSFQVSDIQIIQERNEFSLRASWFEPLEQPHVLICRWSCPACLRLWVTGMLPMRTSWVRNPFDQISLFCTAFCFDSAGLSLCVVVTSHLHCFSLRFRYQQWWR